MVYPALDPPFSLRHSSQSPPAACCPQAHLRWRNPVARAGLGTNEEMADFALRLIIFFAPHSYLAGTSAEFHQFRNKVTARFGVQAAEVCSRQRLQSRSPSLLAWQFPAEIRHLAHLLRSVHRARPSGSPEAPSAQSARDQTLPGQAARYGA